LVTTSLWSRCSKFLFYLYYIFCFCLSWALFISVSGLHSTHLVNYISVSFCLVWSGTCLYLKLYNLQISVHISSSNNKITLFYSCEYNIITTSGDFPLLFSPGFCMNLGFHAICLFCLVSWYWNYWLPHLWPISQMSRVQLYSAISACSTYICLAFPTFIGPLLQCCWLSLTTIFDNFFLDLTFSPLQILC